METHSNEEQLPQLPERPLECSECKKDITVRFSEFEKGGMHELCMCSECPELKKRLFGNPRVDVGSGGKSLAKMVCGDCGTTLESIRVGHPLGCSHCYDLFNEAIVYELRSIYKLPAHLESAKKTTVLHVGRTPGESIEITPSLQLIALNEALDETLKREDYEQAALLRDQIKALNERKVNTESDSEEKKGGADES